MQWYHLAFIILISVFSGMYLMGYVAVSASAQQWVDFWRWWK